MVNRTTRTALARIPLLPPWTQAAPASIRRRTRGPRVERVARLARPDRPLEDSPGHAEGRRQRRLERNDRTGVRVGTELGLHP